jgi:hemolysin activation/secretion protein
MSKGRENAVRFRTRTESVELWRDTVKFRWRISCRNRPGSSRRKATRVSWLLLAGLAVACLQSSIAVAQSAGPGPASAAQTDLAPIPQPNNSQVILDRLDGLRLVETPRKILVLGARGAGVMIDGPGVPDKAAFQATFAAWLGKPISFGDVDTIQAQITQWCRTHGRPDLRATLPIQSVATGVVQFVVESSSARHRRSARTASQR